MRWIRFESVLGLDLVLADPENVEDAGEQVGITVVIVVQVSNRISTICVLDLREEVRSDGIAKRADPTLKVVLLDGRMIESEDGRDIDKPVEI